MAITWTDVTNLASTLTSVPVATQTAIIAQVDLEIASSKWGAFTDLAKKWLAAHLGTLWKRASDSAGAAGPIVGESVGSVSRQFAAASLTLEALGATPFGQEYHRLLKSLLYARVGDVL